MSSLTLKLIQEAKESRATFLDLGNCGLTDLPPELFELTWLQRLNLGTWFWDEDQGEYRRSSNTAKANDLTLVNRDGMVGLTQLQSLDLRDTQISDIRVLAGLTQLQSLDLQSTQISDIGVLAGLTQLQSLDLQSTQISDIGVLVGLTQLNLLDLSYTSISDIGVLAGLTQLQLLYLSGTKIRDIGVLAGLTQLNSLALSGTQISNIRVLAGLTQLNSLDLSSTNIRDIGVLAGLTQLNSLDLSNTSISDIEVLAGLTQLKSLDLSGNKISDIGVLTGLTQLNTLALSYIKISDIGVLARLTHLNSLDLSGTNIRDIRVLAGLTQLKSLDLSGNNIRDIGVLAGLTQLNSLALSYTSISDIGVLAGLTQLKSLDLSGNKISDLSPLIHLIEKGIKVEWGRLRYGTESGIFLEECPLVIPPVDIVKQGNKAILNYFRQIEEQGGTLPLYEAKLIVVGEAGAGKTSLTEKLVDEEHQVVVDDPQKKSTLGINVRENWRFADCERPGESFTAHIWDFGGQEIQYMTHQFFLTPESLYVLVADDRKQHTLFPYWFEVIQLLGKDESGHNSPVLVVLNERNHKSITNFDLIEYRKKYPTIRIDVMEVDLSETNLGRFRQVRDRIQQMLCTLNHVGRQLPKKWPDIRKAIIARNAIQNHLSAAEFATICGQFGVTRPDDQNLISKYLHQLGVILHFQTDIQLRDFIIINPSWALKAVYAVLEDKEVHKRYGRFSEQDLDRYWAALTNEERVKILSLMKKDSFEICYPVDKQSYIAPQLLPTIRPDFPWDNKASLKCQFFYRFMPKGIMTRLIVRKHEDLKAPDLVWARGAVFYRFDCDILVIEEETERNGLIAIEVLGPPSNRIRALDFIRNEIEDIHRKWFSDIEYEERAPCNCDDCQNTAKPTFFAWDKLIQRVEQNRKTIECDNNRVKDVDVLPLLEGISDKQRIDQTLAARYGLDIGTHINANYEISNLITST